MSTTYKLDLGLLSGFTLSDSKPEEGIQDVVNEIFALEREEGTLDVTLPEPSTRLPRQYPLPPEKVETRWEKFAREKGIKNRKKERMVFDEVTQTWKPRYGYGRAIGTGNNVAPIVELKPSDPDDVDPFERAADQRKFKKLKQKRNELRNIERRQGSKGADKGGLTVRPDLEEKRKTLKAVQTSTRSHGRFDDVVKNEPARKIEDRRRKFQPNISDTKEEKARALKVLQRMGS